MFAHNRLIYIFPNNLYAIMQTCVIISDPAQSCIVSMLDSKVRLDFFCLGFVGSGKSASPIWDRLVFNKIKDRLGGRVRFLTSGASPLSPEVMEFLKM